MRICRALSPPKWRAATKDYSVAILLALMLASRGALAADTPVYARAFATVQYGQLWKTLDTTYRHAKVMAVQDLQSSQFEIGVRINTGYFSDPEGLDGLAHAVEHLIVQGTSKPFDMPIRAWARASQSRQLHCQTLETYTNCFVSAGIDEADELLARLHASLQAKEYSVDDIKKQLDDIDAERAGYESSPGGMVAAFESGLVSQRHPAHRNFSSGGATSLRGQSPQQLLLAAQTFLAQHYWGNEADIVLISPLAPQETLRMAQRSLLAGCCAASAHTRDVSDRWGDVFDLQATTQLHTVDSESTDNELVSTYALPFGSAPSSDAASLYRAFDVLQFLLGDTGPKSLASKLSAEGLGHSLGVETSPNLYGNAAYVRIDISLGARGFADVDGVSQAVTGYIKGLALLDRASTATRYETIVELSGLAGPRPNRGRMVFNALDALDSGYPLEAFSYTAKVNASAWRDFQRLVGAIGVTAPVRVYYRGKSSAPDADVTVTSQAYGSSIRLNPVRPTERELGDAGRCIRTRPNGATECLKGLWQVDGIRGRETFVTPLQRTIAEALLAQSKRHIEEKLEAIGQYGGELETSAGSAPAIGVLGPRESMQQVLQVAWAEFLRERSDNELRDLQSALATAPSNAFDLSLELGSDALGLTDHANGRLLAATTSLKREIEELQSRFRASGIRHFRDSIQDAGSHDDTVGSAAAGGSLINVTAKQPFNPGTLLQMRCSRPSASLLSMLRLVQIPSHKFFLNASRSSGDANAFGSFPVREWGDYKCFGVSYDSSTLQGDQLRQRTAALTKERERQFCAMSNSAWLSVKQLVLANEGSGYSNSQAFAVEDLRYWMQFGGRENSARAIVAQARKLRPADVCEWSGAERNGGGSRDRTVAVLVPIAH